MIPIQARHEWKHELSPLDLPVLRQRLRVFMGPDPHARQGVYFIRSLYFDTPSDKALREKLDGVGRREKFRIRYYDQDLSLIHLEKKCKFNGLGTKCSVPLTASETQQILDGDWNWMLRRPEPLLPEFYHKLQTQRLRPKTIVDYTREPFVYPPGNVRVTLDYNIRTGLRPNGFLQPGCLTIPAKDAPIILEVKWDSFLPSLVRDAVGLQGRHACAFSKYAQCRIYG